LPTPGGGGDGGEDGGISGARRTCLGQFIFETFECGSLHTFPLLLRCVVGIVSVAGAQW
jgi:hypothetical protein